MEKHSSYRAADDAFHEHQTRTRTPKHRWAVALLVLCLLSWYSSPGQGTWFPFDNLGPESHAGHHKDTFSWNELESKPFLDYVDCYNGEMQCARLELPMDYWNGTTDASVSIAVVKKPAVVPVTHPQYGGAILFNPGGPGGSGVSFLWGAWPLFRSLIDSDDGKYFDLISFDPRGVLYSKPNLQCIKDSLWDQSWALRAAEVGAFSASDAAIGRRWSMEIAYGGSCSLPPGDGEPDIKQYASTASVARDMLEIVERHGEWREKEAKRLLEGKRCHDSASTDSNVLEALKHRPGKEKINYWGFSYGTYLGNTFAAMFPDRINRLIVDGVVDAYDYKKSLWFDNLVDTEKDMGQFYYHCARVGWPKCAMANETGKTTEAGVQARVTNILEGLYHNPLPVIGPNPDVISYTDVKSLIFVGLYSPIQSFPGIAIILQQIENGDGSLLAQAIRSLHSFSCDGRADDDEPSTTDATAAISCTDGDDQTWLTKDEFGDHLKNLTALSPTFGDIWAEARLRCTHFSIRANVRFEGPWVGNTSHPILEIGNTADPVTPGRYAKKMAKGFTGAVALMQDSPGHCSLAAPSKCTARYVRQYFQTGELPPEDTVCKADTKPFDDIHDDDEGVSAEVIEQYAMFDDALYSSGGGIGRANERIRMGTAF